MPLNLYPFLQVEKKEAVAPSAASLLFITWLFVITHNTPSMSQREPDPLAPPKQPILQHASMISTFSLVESVSWPLFRPVAISLHPALGVQGE